MNVILILLSTFILVYGQPLKFSNTQKLDEGIEKVKDIKSLLSINWSEISQLPEPPDDQAESGFLIMLQDEKLNDVVIAKIKEQEFLDFYYFGKDLFENRPNTEKLFKVIDLESKIALLNQKLKFDRVRPKYVNTALNEVIETPSYPSYPSGDATQSRLFAMLFTSLDPANKDKYMALADEIALNKELAGLNYRSDSYIGKLYAQFILGKLMENQMFQGLYFAAVSEWGKEDDFVAKFAILKVLTLKQ